MSIESSLMFLMWFNDDNIGTSTVYYFTFIGLKRFSLEQGYRKKGEVTQIYFQSIDLQQAVLDQRLCIHTKQTLHLGQTHQILTFITTKQNRPNPSRSRTGHNLAKNLS
jgi:hypothetical protein